LKCPQCGNSRIKYNTKLIKVKDRDKGKTYQKREDYTVKCKKCKYEGEIK